MEKLMELMALIEREIVVGYGRWPSAPVNFISPLSPIGSITSLLLHQTYLKKRRATPIHQININGMESKREDKRNGNVVCFALA